MGLDVYVEKWRLDNANSKNKKGIGAFLGAAGASLLQQQGTEDGVDALQSTPQNTCLTHASPMPAAYPKHVQHEFNAWPRRI